MCFAAGKFVRESYCLSGRKNAHKFRLQSHVEINDDDAGGVFGSSSQPAGDGGAGREEKRSYAPLEASITSPGRGDIALEVDETGNDDDAKPAIKFTSTWPSSSIKVQNCTQANITVILHPEPFAKITTEIGCFGKRKQVVPNAVREMDPVTVSAGETRELNPYRGAKSSFISIKAGGRYITGNEPVQRGQRVVVYQPGQALTPWLLVLATLGAALAAVSSAASSVATPLGRLNCLPSVPRMRLAVRQCAAAALSLIHI